MRIIGQSSESFQGFGRLMGATGGGGSQRRGRPVQNLSLLHEAFDSVADQLALIDRDGIVLNANWSWVASRHGRGGLSAPAPVGTNYLELCGRAARRDPAAARVMKGIREVLDGTAARLRVEFPTRAAKGRRWNVLIATPLRTPRGGALISCADATRQRVAQRQVRTLSRMLLEAHERERKAIARELHDDVTQQIAAAALDLSMLLPRMTADAESAKAGAGKIVERLRKLCTHVHGLSRRMHPHTLETQGLARAIRNECRGFEERSGIGMALRVHGAEQAIPPAVALAAFRICQEALHNAQKHARATGVTVDLERTPEEVRMTVKDAGVGFDVTPAGDGLGLCGMRERALAVGGRLSVISAPGRGTTVKFTAPLTQGDRA
jgi:signal transduction histidine kinase